MKFNELVPVSRDRVRDTLRSDEITQPLILLMFVLLAALAALAADLWFGPNSQGPVAQAAEAAVAPQLSAIPPSPSATLTLQPTATLTPTKAPPEVPGVTPPACVPPDDWGIYVVQEGNTLYSIGQRFGVDVDTLMHVNCLNTYTIFINQRLYVPGGAATPIIPTVAPTFTSSLTSTPQPGETATVSVEGPDIVPADIPDIPTPSSTSTPRSAFRVRIPNRYLNIVLLGSDKRPNSGAWRTDSMIIVSVDTETEVVRLLSIPRDLWVYIPGHGYNRINTADLWGELSKKGSGPERVKKTIHHNLGIPIHYYVRVDFQGFMNIIDTVGGVDIDVDCPLPDINLTAGMHHMNARQALRYARSRKSTNDFDRGRRQRKVLLALWDQALTLNIIPKIPVLWRTMSDSYQTDLPLEQVINLAYVGVHLKPQNIKSKAISGKEIQAWTTPQGAAVLLPREGRIRTLLETFYAPTDPDDLDGDDKVRVQILNGSKRKQAEELAAAALKWEGFKAPNRGIAQRRDYAQTKIFVLDGDVTLGEEVAKALRVPATAVQEQAYSASEGEPAESIDVQVILGGDYNPCQR
jgi:LCP family protein required for cell wall assembly